METVAETCLQVNGTKVLEPQRQTTETRDERREAGDERPVESLTCHRCGKVSIHAPAGATSKTRYICPNCAPLAPELTHFDRHQFEEPFMAKIGVEFNSMDMIFEHEREIASRKSITLLKAISRGEQWAVNATTENVLKLPRKQKIAMLLVVFCDMKLGEAAFLSQDEYHHVNQNIIAAKRSLSTKQQHTICASTNKPRPTSRRENSKSNGRSPRLSPPGGDEQFSASSGLTGFA